ncbi:Short chain dehydrogenase citE [Pseudocercospora fuligena]|uniref:Short chain dehydrogenase citE n=1 Tax=Pseudocercospora fuligena TaxID=685502 RepID=A0A8H6R9M8_9PEZI|nr:Short chain dehydrogenase citE [Pseudocercospora fuligena]
MAQFNFPDHFGINFTPTLHHKAEGPTQPEQNIKSNFVVAVIGSGRGIGAHTAYAYARAGAKGITITSRTVAELKIVEEKLLAINSEIEILSQTCDVSKQADVEALAKATMEKFGRLDVVIANAGVMSKPIAASVHSEQRMPIGVEEDDFQRVIDINLIGTWNIARNFVPLLQANKDGAQAFIIITSASGHFSDSNMTPLAYNISKFALNRLAEHLHKDHFRRDGVQTFAVHPGAVLTSASVVGSEEAAAEGDFTMDDPGLCGGFLTWLTKQRRPWLSGRYISVNWDVEELEVMRNAILKEDKLVHRMVV